jgi:hypothetical protein
MSGSCSIYPLIPSQINQSEDNPESRYRNVLSVKADESEILLAIVSNFRRFFGAATFNLLCFFGRNMQADLRVI